MRIPSKLLAEVAMMQYLEGSDEMISRTAIEDYTHSVWKYIAKRESTLMADKLISPLTWYIDTGRASTDFLNKLIDTKYFVIARVLMKAGITSDDSVIAAVRKRIGYTEGK